MRLKNIMLSFLLMFTISLSVFAVLPNNTLIIGTKSCSIEYLFNSSSEPVINGWLATETFTNIWYQLDGMNTTFEDIFTGAVMTAVEMAGLPQIEYTTDGVTFVKYRAGNGDIIPNMSANVTVEIGSLNSFKNITVNSLDNVDGAAKFKTNIGTGVKNIGETLTVMTNDATITIYIMDSTDVVIATALINVLSASTFDVALTE